MFDGLSPLANSGGSQVTSKEVEFTGVTTGAPWPVGNHGFVSMSITSLTKHPPEVHAMTLNVYCVNSLKVLRVTVV